MNGYIMKTNNYILKISFDRQQMTIYTIKTDFNNYKSINSYACGILTTSEDFPVDKPSFLTVLLKLNTSCTGGLPL